MKTLSCLACCALLLASAPARALDIKALDITPHFPPRVADIPIRWVHFADGENRYVLKVPLGVEMSEADGGTLFRFQNITDATLAIRKSPLTPAIAFGEPSLDTYRKAALAFAPGGATDLVIEKEASSSIPIAGSTSYCFWVDFKLPGRSLKMAITFTNINAQQQIVLITLAPGKQFNNAESLSSEILSSWHLALPNENLNETPTS